MDRMTLWIVGLSLCSFAGYLLFRPLRERPRDRSAIDIFTKQRGLSVIAVVRSNGLRHWLREIIANDVPRSYVVTVEDSEGRRCDFYAAFDPFFGFRRTDALERQSLALTPPGEVVNLTQYGPAPVRLSRYERAALFTVGACVGGFIFSGVLHTILSPPTRPFYPEPTLNYTYPIKTKYGDAYGTYFEYLTVTYGIWVTWGSGAAISLFSHALGVPSMGKEAAYRRRGWQVLAVAIISYALYFAIWRVFNL
jgi:hypothetical protein